MTKAEWLSSTAAGTMLNFLRGKANSRQLRLFAVACCRRVFNLLVERHRRHLELNEMFADGQANLDQLEAGWHEVPQILADALEEAGCTNEDVLGHLRWPELHVRGCWVLDQLLGRA